LKPAVAWSLLGASVVALVILMFLSPWNQLVNTVPLEKPPEVLLERARGILADFGYVDDPMDSVWGFQQNYDYLQSLPDEGLTPEQFESLRSTPPAALVFSYRQSPELLVKSSSGSAGAWFTDPPPTRPGMVEISLDPAGRMVEFTAIPSEAAETAETAEAAEADEADEAEGERLIETSISEPDWEVALAAAGLAIEELELVGSEIRPPVYADHTVAWRGSFPDVPGVPWRFEAAGLAGRIVAFKATGPWFEPLTPEGTPVSWKQRVTQGIFAFWYVVVLGFGAVVAWRNIRLGRSHAQGALRFALYFMVIRMAWLLGAHHLPSAAETDLLRGHLAWAAYRFCFVWVLYVALEPYARRLWPRMLVSWVRLLNGRWRDPQVCRDLLVGITASLVQGAALFGLLFAGLPLGLKIPVPGVNFWQLEALRGPMQTVVAILGNHSGGIYDTFFVIFILLLVRLVVRKTWIAVVIMTLMQIFVMISFGGDPRMLIVAGILVAVVMFIVLFRFGLLAVMVYHTVNSLTSGLPLTADPSSWYFGTTLCAIVLLLGLASWGAYHALGKRFLASSEV
jgi:hypothetical protein